MSQPVIQYYKSADKQFSIVCGRGISKRFPMHRHLSVSIGAIIDGMRLLMLKDKKYIIGKGDIFIINSKEPHSVGENINPVHDYIVVSVSKLLVDNYLGTHNTRFENIIENNELSELLTGWFTDLILNNRIKATYDIKLLIAGIAAFQKSEIPDKPENSAIAKIQILLDKDSLDNHSIESLADKAFLSPFHFSRLFKKQTGLAPHQYLLDNRLRQARELLENNYSVVDVSIACGFYDASHFIRHFSNYYGVFPLDFQKGINHLNN